jgi:MFS family permease
MLLFAASAPSPLYVVYQARWHFSPIVLTSVFAVYALALLVALVLAGSLSDRIGRRPALLVALTLQILAMALFVGASGVGSLFGARILQGLGTGMGTGAISAALFDLQPLAAPALGALVGSVAPPLGLAAGALGSGLLVQYGPDPLHLVYWVLLAVFAAGICLVLAMPETVASRGGWLRSLRPRVGVPREVRSSFAAVAPGVIAMWALSGLYLSLGPSLSAALLRSDSHVIGGLVIVALTGSGALASIGTRGWPPDRAIVWGSAGLAGGVVVTMLGLQTESTMLYLAGSVVSGLGFGPAFSGVFRALTGRAPADRRAALIAALYILSYLAFSLPAVAAGIAVGRLGLHTTALVYGGAVVALSVIATGLYLLQSRRAPAPAVPVNPRECMPCPGTVAPHPAGVGTD